MTKAALEAAVNALLAPGQPITANGMHKPSMQQIIDELYDSQSRGDVLQGVAAVLSGVSGDHVLIIRSGIAKLLPVSTIGEGGAVASVNGNTGVVVLGAADVGADAAGSAAAVAASVIGVQDLFIPASAMWGRVTAGCSALSQTEIATSLFNIQSLDFDQTTQEFCQFQIVLPRKYNNGTITAVFHWTATSGSGTVQWGIKAVSLRNDDPLTTAFGTEETADDTLIATGDVHISPETDPITPAGTITGGNFMGFQISRNVASDTLSADAKLLGVSLRITTNAAKDA